MAAAPGPSIEVERKFKAPLSADELNRLVAVKGGTSLGTVRFTDTYFDTADCVLTRQDAWLRRRDGQWELKVPVEEDARRSGGERTVFTEIEGAAGVAAALQRLRPARFAWEEEVAAEAVEGEEADAAEVKKAEASERLARLLRAADVRPFAEFETVRSKMRLGQCAIDLDAASFGASLFEIEMMCETADQVAAAEAEIERVAGLLQAKPLSKASGGKLETYIRSYCPGVLAQLIEAGVLKDTSTSGDGQ